MNNAIAGALTVGIGAIVVVLGTVNAVVGVRRAHSIEALVGAHPEHWLRAVADADRQTVGDVFVTRVAGKASSGSPRVTGRWIVVGFDDEHLGIYFPQLVGGARYAVRRMEIA